MKLKNIQNFFSGKKVFITGHTGFKGSWLSYLLYKSGAHVTGFALPPEGPRSHFNLINLENNISHIIGDIRDKELIFDAIKKSKPDVVFHLAAQALVKSSYLDPVDTFLTNFVGSLNVLRLSSIQRL